MATKKQIAQPARIEMSAMLCDVNVASNGPTITFGATAHFTADADRDAFIAAFPRYIGLRACRLGGGVETGYHPIAWLPIFLPSTSRNARNEAGIRRIRGFLKALREAGISHAWKTIHGPHSIASAEALEAAMADMEKGAVPSVEVREVRR